MKRRARVVAKPPEVVYCAHMGLSCSHSPDASMGDGTLCTRHAAEQQIELLECGKPFVTEHMMRALLWKVKQLREDLDYCTADPDDR